MRAPIEAHELPYPGDVECDYDAESACVQCVSLRAEILHLRAELAATKCRGCGKSLLDVRPVDDGNRRWCSVHCWIQDVKRPTDCEF
jgi:hypothetical protein